jgi:hypothetical protein
LHECVEFTLHDGCKLQFERLDCAVSSDLRGALITFLFATEAMNVELSLGDVGDVIVFEV